MQHLIRAPRFKPTVLASLIAAALSPQAAMALDLATSPPSATSSASGVAPNVILSLDDSDSMNAPMYSRDGGVPLGTRVDVLKKALTQVFSDTSLLPDGSIRLAWQAM
ncbi:MAG: hypothetical protein EOO32_01530, partial [Comamonadaceae bacterium]